MEVRRITATEEVDKNQAMVSSVRSSVIHDCDESAIWAKRLSDSLEN